MWTSEKLSDRLRAFWLGFKEAASDSGLTWEDDDGLNEAYDLGRAWGRRVRFIPD